MAIVFEGQQSDEVILAELRPHALPSYVQSIGITFLALAFIIISFAFSSYLPTGAWIMRGIAAILGLGIIILGINWTNSRLHTSVTFLTDRRIIRFDKPSPFYVTKRALFWNEVLKAKGYAPGIIQKIYGIGTIVVEPQLSEHENIVIYDMTYYEDIANYIDKILFTFKNKPTETASLQAVCRKTEREKGLKRLLYC